MTFQKACVVSLGLHILLFGCAIAVAAGYAGGAFRMRQDVLLVSLAGPGADLRGRGMHKKDRETATAVAAPAATVRAETARKEMPAPASPVPEAHTEVNRQAESMTDGQDAGTGQAGQKGQGGQTASETGAGFGLASAEQWAAIEAAIERSKNYPKMARERGIQGVVLVRFKLRPSGDVEAAEIMQSSGHDVLDSASIRTVYRAAALMPYVDGWLDVPITYVLK